jgi:hypothetical protein
MPTKADIARDWGTSPEYVIKCVKKGCPTDSFENARDWRKAHASSRPPTSPVQIARQLAEEKDADSPAARKSQKKYFQNKPNGFRVPAENSLDDALRKAITASDEAFRLLAEAMLEDKDSKISVRLTVFNKAQEGLFKAETAYREEMERRRILIPLAKAKEIARRGYEVIIQRLNVLPQNAAQRCNPTDPDRAITVLESECTAILADAQEVYASWSDDRAPASNSPQL